jgi:glycosyltransferase involved in cell wall biosynthesis
MPRNIGSQSPRLSLIIPARNEARRLPSSLEKIARILSTKRYSAEVIVVDNGSTDGTRGKVREFANQHQWLPLIVIDEPCPGKGAAVRTGMLYGKGDILFLCDADLSMPIEELDRFFVEPHVGADIVIGCRETVRAILFGEPV